MPDADDWSKYRQGAGAVARDAVRGMSLPFDLSLATAAYMAVVLFSAAFVRGYSGFGMPALVMTSTALVMDPLVWVPVVLMAEVVLTLQQAPGIWRSVDWRRAFGLAGGALIGVPLGVYALSGIGLDLLRAVLSGFVLVMCLLLWTGWRFARSVGDGGHVGVGLISGMANAAAVGGLPVAVFFSSLGLPAVTFRATIIAYFAMLDIWSTGTLWATGRITAETLVAVAMALPLLMAGIWLGGRQFRRAAPQEFRRFAIVLLAALAGLGLLKSVF
tara:strand:- start:807 stop:1625 length:819 start_codon:yes stop_codon:yes gene_type:complete